MQKRIKELRELLKMNQTLFSESLGVKQGTVAGWEKGNAVPESMIRLICLTHNVRRNWLTTGDGKVFNETSCNKMSDKEITREYVYRIMCRLPESMKEEAVEIAKAILEGRERSDSSSCQSRHDSPTGGIVDTDR